MRRREILGSLGATPVLAIGSTRAVRAQTLVDASAKFEHIPRGFPARDLVWEGFCR